MVHTQNIPGPGQYEYSSQFKNDTADTSGHAPFGSTVMVSSPVHLSTPAPCDNCKENAYIHTTQQCTAIQNTFNMVPPGERPDQLL